MSKGPSWTKAYLWHYMPNMVDGILVSRMALSSKRVSNLRAELGFEGTILGDSGAHSYRRLEEPPFSCEDLLEFYAEGEFDYGLSLDVVASPWVRPGGLSNPELEHRLQLTVSNAERCLHLYEKSGYSFELIGVVQGWDAKSYRYCAQELLRLGFSYIAIAGQRNPSLLKESILVVLDEVRKVQRSVKVHILGTGTPVLLNFYVAHGIPSFDSATWLRKAWLSEKHNYFMVDGARYSSYRATRVGLSDIDLSELEWSTEVRCPCPLCQDLGQQILLFRGHERNTRRGFHNIYQYVRLLNAHRNRKFKVTMRVTD